MDKSYPESHSLNQVVHEAALRFEDAGLTSLDDVPQYLVETMTAGLEDDPLPSVMSIKLSNEQARWRAISSLQKAIRRGDAANARAMVSALVNSGHEDTVIKRMCVIALEDVAFGNPLLCAQMMCYASAKKVRNAVGGLPYLLRLAERMCESVKDRIPNEIAVSANAPASHLGERMALYGMPSSAVYEIALEWQNYHWSDVMTASRFLSGHIKFGGEFASDHRSIAQYRSLFASTPMLLQYIGHRASVMGGEPTVLASGMRMGWHLLYDHADAEPLRIHAPDLEPAPVVKAITLPGLDMHTQEGKRAYYRLLKNEGKELAEWVKEAGGDPLKALSHGVFIVEGKACNMRLHSSDTEQITHTSHEGQMSHTGLPESRLGMLLDEVEALLPALNAHRTSVLMG